ncbi:MULTISPECIES: DUF1697 domain-containing protein [Paenibacillus]|uniref:Cytoplasmic protein n=1 Tax=Paenibacillus odorifer TaxID=189426 RepID=A0A1R0WVH7_9BACL|nr:MULTISPECIES: DUF1697 domain-containing protein [Paenibacillus]AIQ72305.1 hypothetical protein PODO_02900 [Paenibacillus odorifer]ETT67714.1 hypothetical protein C171_03130 [Paenibacillus sp. FSL H8-237]MEC0130970.1 DUF1697 domain-containing protein [Paenibacillus odorifer]MEC0222355.1 DUF1697 domain-containing protein [Paenibacillus odorifer]OMC95911.1 hypothetical protein BJP46_28820 [Paenibacillus odorifer]
MTTYIALLRGINVGGNKIIKMLDLKAMFQALGFANVRTYIQSGNVVFESDEGSVSLLSGVIERQIHEVFGFEVSVIIRTLAEMENVIANDPFQLSEPEEFKRWYVTFLPAEPSAEALDKLRTYENGPDKVRFVGREMYILYEVSVSQSPLFKVPFDKILGMPITARNWNTVNKLVAIGKME